MNNKKFGFTLAEVLITLAIIGVVAALTLPTLTSAYKKHVAETRLAKFYTTFTQAIEISQTVNGNYMDWDWDITKDDTTAIRAWLDKYITPFVNVKKIETYNVGVASRNILWLLDGSLVIIAPTESWLYFPESKDFKMNAYEKYDYPDISTSGTKWFTFVFQPKGSIEAYKGYKNKSLVPYTPSNGSLEVAKNSNTLGCKPDATNERAYCAYVIQQNNWKIPNDYPLRF